MTQETHPMTAPDETAAENYRALLHQAEAAGFGTVDEWIAYLRDEIAEQARVNGMGSEREAALMGEIARLRGANEAARALLEECYQHEYNPFEPDNQTQHFNLISAFLKCAALGERQP